MDGLNLRKSPAVSVPLDDSPLAALLAHGDIRSLVAIDEVDAAEGSMQTLPMGTNGQRILPNQTVQITWRPQRGPFRPRRLIIAPNPERWMIEDIQIGNRSQFLQAGPIGGAMFGSGVIDFRLSFETVQTAMDLVIIVRYVGDNLEGEPFSAAMIGKIKDDAELVLCFDDRAYLVRKDEILQISESAVFKREGIERYAPPLVVSLRIDRSAPARDIDQPSPYMGNWQRIVGATRISDLTIRREDDGAMLVRLRHASGTFSWELFT